VLIVDDEQAVREVAAAVLRRHGADVLLAGDGAAALELYRQRPEAINLVLLDLTMPGLSGEDVLRALHQSGAGPKVVVMSGYSEQETMRRCAELGAVGFLRKPFELATIIAKMREHLG
jgi:CheY-like chemotaxis protein